MVTLQINILVCGKKSLWLELKWLRPIFWVSLDLPEVWDKPGALLDMVASDDAIFSEYTRP